MAEAPQEGCRYMDFLVLGKTGMGKSTTADRLLIANSIPGTFDVDPKEEGGNTLLDDILIWRTSTESVDDIKERVKYFLVNRAGRVSPRDAIDPKSASSDAVTQDCVLLSNKETNVRVLDVPGFHTTFSTLAPHDAELRANQDNLSIMRQILRIQSMKQLRFDRILYFLPFQMGNPSVRADANFQEELRIMHHYFGIRIFDSMVVIATFPLRWSRADAFTPGDETIARNVLNRAFQHVFGTQNNQNPDDVSLEYVPQPPIFYISVEESGTDIFRRLQITQVPMPHGLELRLNENTCARCSLKFGVYHMRNGATPLVAINDGQRSAYDQSKCHPLIKPKHSQLTKFIGGIAYILLLGIPKLAGDPWPGFFNDDEECVHCKKPPGSPGCLKVGSEWRVKDSYMIKVDHSSSLDEFRVAVQ